jgi:hypothetical protein
LFTTWTYIIIPIDENPIQKQNGYALTKPQKIMGIAIEIHNNKAEDCLTKLSFEYGLAAAHSPLIQIALRIAGGINNRIAYPFPLKYQVIGQKM